MGNQIAVKTTAEKYQEQVLSAVEDYLQLTSIKDEVLRLNSDFQLSVGESKMAGNALENALFSHSQLLNLLTALNDAFQDRLVGELHDMVKHT